MNMYTLFMVVREANNLSSRHAIESFLMELTTVTDITAIYNNSESMGQFIYYNITTELSREQVNHIAHAILNDFEDETGPWNQRGNMRKLRRHLIVRCSVME